MSTLKTLSTKALKYSQIRAGVIKSLGVLADKFAKLRNPLLLKVGPQIAAADKLRDEILALLPSLENLHFLEPKSQVLHGVKVGFRKASDTIQADDEAKSIEIMQAHPVARSFLVSTVSINYGALEGLSDAQLNGLGMVRVKGMNAAFCSVSDGLESVAKKLGIGAQNK